MFTLNHLKNSHELGMNLLKNNICHYVFIIQTTFLFSSFYIDWVHGNIQKLFGITCNTYNEINGTFKIKNNE